MEDLKDKGIKVSVYLALALAVGVVYIQVANHEFVSFDDDWYIYNNPYVKEGLTKESIQWAFSFTDQINLTANWHPLTSLSHVLDGQLYGLNPTGHHLTNVALHGVNACLVLAVFHLMTGRFWPSAFVAAVFALHPLHVESVAWASERKDVLSTMFWLLTMIAYIKYARQPGILRYMAVMLSLTLGLLAKPMLVTVPFVLLLLDYWPLERFEWKRPPRLVLEKVPLFILSGAICITTILAQKKVLAVADRSEFPFDLRVANSLMAYLKYIGKTFWPLNLSFFYPISRQAIPIWLSLAALSILILISVATCLMVKKRYLFTGWFWFLGTLLPVIGLVQVGRQSMADRYMYVPLIGLSIMIAWGIPDLLTRITDKKIILMVFSVVSLLILSMVSFVQVKYWANSLSLYERGTKAVKNNWWAHHLLANELLQNKQYDKAVENYERVLQIRPGSVEAMKDLAYSYLLQENYPEAIGLYTQMLPEISDDNNLIDTGPILSPDAPRTAKEHAVLRFYLESRLNLGTAYERTGSLDEAASQYLDVLRIQPDHVLAHKNLALIYLRQNKSQQAINHLTLAVALRPEDADVHVLLGRIYNDKGDYDKAIEHFKKAIGIEPQSYVFREDLARAYLGKGMLDEAVEEYMYLLKVYPEWSGLLATVSNIIATNKQCKYYDPKRAIDLARRACEIEYYQRVELIDNLAMIYAINDDYAKAIETTQKALDVAMAQKRDAIAAQMSKQLQSYRDQLNKKGKASGESAEKELPLQK